ncbi:unnamed protein product [Orchesella dallaii]|uniref:FHA domain-containing protein n=1 Tax=Orchesella dallaii TaxID=48710 RepID=A0ABP1PU09_9HEXA
MLRIVHIDAPQGPTSYNLLAERDYTIGRNEGDIKFPHDPSMKKRHAKLEVSHSIGNLANPMITPTIAITPIVRGAIITATNRGSDEAFDIGEKADIGDGQKFSLGGIPNVFEIHYTPFVAVFSGRIQGEIQLQIQQLGGHSLRQWCKDATHLVTDEVELSLDVCGALLAGKPLVTQGFITKLLSFYKKEINTKPDPQDYLPLVAARSLDTNEPIPASAFKPNPDRASLFQGKTFVLRTMPLLNDSKAVIAAGGWDLRI